MSDEQIERAARRLWQAHVRGVLTWDEWQTMTRIIGADGFALGSVVDET